MFKASKKMFGAVTLFSSSTSSQQKNILCSQNRLQSSGFTTTTRRRAFPPTRTRRTRRRVLVLVLSGAFALAERIRNSPLRPPHSRLLIFIRFHKVTEVEKEPPRTEMMSQKIAMKNKMFVFVFSSQLVLFLFWKENKNLLILLRYGGLGDIHGLPSFFSR